MDECSKSCFGRQVRKADQLKEALLGAFDRHKAILKTLNFIIDIP